MSAEETDLFATGPSTATQLVKARNTYIALRELANLEGCRIPPLTEELSLNLGWLLTGITAVRLAREEHQADLAQNALIAEQLA